ncbi:hypothetical protein ACNJYA_09635 [Bradyrhizobium sp. DASA03068]|uniref:hypothetical protein n=1 Tax=Bradyrhizobium sp. BLXBL-01 TaxID=3395915 RepID=UPI003F712679
MMSGTITLLSSQFQTGTPLVIELLDGDLNRRWQGAVIVNEPAPFPIHLAAGIGTIVVAFPSGHTVPVPLIPISGEAKGGIKEGSIEQGAIRVELPRMPEAAALADGRRLPSGRSLEDVWVRLWSQGKVGRWRVQRWKPTFHPNADGSVSGEFRSGELHTGQHFLQIGTGLSQPRMTAIPMDGATFVLRPDPRRSDDAVEVAVNIDVDAGSPGARTLLRYLSNGDLERARIVGDTLLPGDPEMLDLTTAVIGSYYLLACGDMDRLERLLTASMSKWANCLPDFAVIAAWGCLRREQPDAVQARQHLLDASKCGVPVYTRGLRLMVDGLRMVMTDEALRNNEVDGADKWLRKFAGVADWRATFTTFRAAHPNKPTSSSTSMNWLTEAGRARSDPLSLFPWASASRSVSPHAGRDESSGHLSAAFSRAFASLTGNVGAAEAYKAFNDSIAQLCGATP